MADRIYIMPLAALAGPRPGGIGPKYIPEIEAAGFRLREDLGFLEYQYFLLFDGQ